MGLSCFILLFRPVPSGTWGGYFEGKGGGGGGATSQNWIVPNWSEHKGHRCWDKRNIFHSPILALRKHYWWTITIDGHPIGDHPSILPSTHPPTDLPTNWPTDQPSVCLSICLSDLLVYLSVRLSVWLILTYLPIDLCVCLSVCLSVCLLTVWMRPGWSRG